jgi:hypothetical protein
MGRERAAEAQGVGDRRGVRAFPRRRGAGRDGEGRKKGILLATAYGYSVWLISSPNAHSNT